jgi:UDP-N-acetylmuramate--alanine ligase
MESTVQVVYFIGIGGIGMSALARYFHTHGRKVSGYDRTETGLTRQLVKEGISVHYTDDPATIPGQVDLVVYTPAIPANLRELQVCKERGYRMMKRSEVLGVITGESFSIAVAGTHGKTTISTMIAHLLRHSGYGCNAFLGGISVNYNTNYWSDPGNVCVVEADEYDRSFLHLHPDVAVISAMDPDHLDIYGTAEAVDEAFIEFTGKLKSGGVLVHKYELGKAGKLKGKIRLTYSIKDAKASTLISSLQVKDGYYVFDVYMGEVCFKNVELHMGGIHNVENVAAAITVAHHLGIKEQFIKEAVASFRGVKRRFEYVISPLQRNDGWIMVDDYAHHPEELRALIESIRGLFPDRKCTLIFQPHLYTRTRDFADQFAEVLDSVDKVILLPIYPARELPVEGVNSEMLLSRMKNKNAAILSKEALMDWIRAVDKRDLLLVTAGAGDIDTVPQQVLSWVEQQAHAIV